MSGRRKREVSDMAHELHHCPTCTCITQLRADRFGILLSPYHTLCPSCERAIARDLLKRMGGICQICQNKMERKVITTLTAV